VIIDVYMCLTGCSILRKTSYDVVDLDSLNVPSCIELGPRMDRLNCHGHPGLTYAIRFFLVMVMVIRRYLHKVVDGSETVPLALRCIEDGAIIQSRHD
jgi:hypothetical protein